MSAALRSARSRSGVAALALALTLAAASSARAANLIVAPGAIGQPLDVTVENESATVWLLDAVLEAESIPPFVLNLAPNPATTTPGDIAPLGSGVANLSFDVSAGATPGSVDTLRFVLTTSANDTVRVEVRLVVGFESPTLTLPYFSDLESDAGGLLGFGSWQWGTPASGPGAAASGANCWATNLAGNYPDGASDALYLPPLDLSGAIAPRLTFNHWHDAEWRWDGGVVRISTDSGATFVDVAPFGGYPGQIGGAPAFTGRSDAGIAYRPVTIFLGDLPLSPRAILALDFSSDSETNDAGWYVDDIGVSEGPDRDLGLSGVGSPPSVVGPFSATVTLTARLRNFGTGTYSVLVRAVADTAGDSDVSPAPFRDSTVVGPLGPGVEATVNFAAPLAALGFVRYHARFSLVLAGDTYAANDTASVPFTPLPVRAPPVFESFETASALGAAAELWELGVPSGGPGGAFEGSRCWGATLAGGYPTGANAALDLGAFDFTTLTAPRLRFREWHRLEAGYDGLRVRVSADGSVWTDVAPSGGYDGAIEAFDGASGWTGESGGWLARTFDLSAFAGEARVVAQLVLGSDPSGGGAGAFVDSLTVDEAPAVGVEEIAPRALAFGFAGANPSAGPMRLRLALPRGGPVRLEVFGVNGRREATVVDRWLAAGTHPLEWSGRDARGRRVAPGVYLLRVTTPEGARVLRAVALR